MSESVDAWTKEKEAEHEAEILAKELEQMRKDEEEASSRADSAKKRARSKSPKNKAKSPSKSLIQVFCIVNHTERTVLQYYHANSENVISHYAGICFKPCIIK